MNQKEVELELAQKLFNGEFKKEDKDEAARRKLPVKTEIRVQSDVDPVAEETKQYRKMAKEVDDRYDKVGRRNP
ncbi:hypothetical protein [Paenibacillus mucilaginosus]|uniref:Uncharacterized protein n=3 Tax=Paenibacillus mucilaginosus TaxID=61624 RepID=H6ND42_9BACL|nr:hypothetical protein [Paenibacillus mucilaginosus]AEI41465.1 hypothetical protein KNP414_02907 [Paenibacillus mucilaginosus KNP414]AFC30003.1 hypothetical protein PM3016_3148 [Paenibacillus mucilaginosus 3016]AFH62190.1 hypothetical protein B2K_15920 [Paenibacillus mucilaginosus K02]MCG7215494.1 hypothetical protein [Paenibacillus mucilaginosus]WDM30478.1 hypothetical protein KCX80_15585 [Paenibacillus mucilaginosus]